MDAFSLQCKQTVPNEIITFVAVNKRIMDELSDKPVYSQEVIEFITVAREFCTFLENLEGMKGRDLMTIFHKLLPLLYYKGSVLPVVEPEYQEGNEKFVTEEQWLAIRLKVINALGEADDYLEVYDDRIEDFDHPPTGSISENVADVYQDLKDFLMLYSTGVYELMNDALWECRQHFEQSWGRKTASTVSAAHDILFSGKPVSFDPPPGPGTTQPDTSNWIFTQRQRNIRDEDE